MTELPIYPAYYHCRGRTSDRDWVLARMSEIPKSLQQVTADEYERIFMSERHNGRKKANKYLGGVALEYRSMNK